MGGQAGKSSSAQDLEGHEAQAQSPAVDAEVRAVHGQGGDEGATEGLQDAAASKVLAVAGIEERDDRAGIDESQIERFPRKTSAIPRRVSVAGARAQPPSPKSRRL